MKIEEVLAQVDELKPNQYGDAVKVLWLSTLDGKIFNDIVLTHERESINEKRKRLENEKLEKEKQEEDIATYDNDPENPDDPENSDDPENPDDPEEPEEEPVYPDDPIREPEGEEIEPEVNEDEFVPYTINDLSKELIACDSYADFYIDYVFAMIDYNNQELDRYANSMQMFNAKYQQFVNYYNRNYLPLRKQYKF